MLKAPKPMTSKVPGTAPTIAKTEGIDKTPTENKTLNIKANVRYLHSVSCEGQGAKELTHHETVR